jgi:2-amino-4,5-dihydroxy-6-oxo-7-(phosphonooxy)heptanoate synthase
VTLNASFGQALRLRRLFRHGDGRLFVVPLDHSVTDGPVTSDGDLDELVGAVAGNGADAIVLHKGSLRHVRPQWFQSTSLIVHLSASTARAADPDAKFLVGTVEEAVRLGADAVSVHVNLGSRTEARQIADLAAIGEACDRCNVPLLAMVYPRGPRLGNGRDPEFVAHAVTIAADLGAGVVKTALPDPVSALRDITRRCPIPVLVAGGAVAAADDAFERVRGAIACGAAGIAVGRNVFQAPDPGAMTRKLGDLVHGRFESVDPTPGERS